MVNEQWFIAGLGAVLGGFVVWLVFHFKSVALRTRLSLIEKGLAIDEKLSQFSSQLGHLSDQLTSSTVNLVSHVEGTKGDLRQEVADRLTNGFSDIRKSVEIQLKEGRQEQASGLHEARTELTNSLTATTVQLTSALDALGVKTTESLEAIRGQVDIKLLAISNQVQQKLDDNIREGFAHFTKVQEHLKAAEEQLRQVGALGVSITNLNNLLKLPHLRGKFGEASLERLLADFLPVDMYELQSSPGEGGGRADALILFPGRKLPVDAKFPREQVLPLFESNDEAEITEARKQFERVMKEQAKRIKVYIQPENGTTDIALMYLPSETLYLETIRNRDLADWLNQQKVFPVSPNTLLITLHTITLVYRWYEAAQGFEKSIQALRKAQKSFEHFDNKFLDIGKSLDKAQEAYGTARGHLTRYRGRVADVTGEEETQLELVTQDDADVQDEG